MVRHDHGTGGGGAAGISQESVLRELRRLRAEVEATQERATLALHVALAALGGARTAPHLVDDMVLAPEARAVVAKAHGILDEAMDRVARHAGPEAAEAG